MKPPSIKTATAVLAGAAFMLPASGHADGQADYAAMCGLCHTAGIAGAPMLGDQTAWADRLAKGADALYASAIAGSASETGVMPPKGGFANMTDAQVKAVVDYMIEAAR